ncbi:hypothetical protein CK489_07090 [Bradyrhizobium sp. UFLA03-84]|uniref:hypothetical protein n=1 Tax=Bradyrhizobium sp. UFLA03-84 TaxID=418599 RepID=UPI000BAE0164|nr:hypothetical protein [Bradyrhizobium sp. UFLA03-84]PAY10290.1 hypothetical protein CK489_07090 [Bradyrhizobium sp. UFLA03-84]
MLVFLRLIGRMAETLVSLPFRTFTPRPSTLTLLSALTLSAETAVVIGAITEPIGRRHRRDGTGEARATATIYFFMTSSVVIEPKPFAWSPPLSVPRIYVQLEVVFYSNTSREIEPA